MDDDVLLSMYVFLSFGYHSTKLLNFRKAEFICKRKLLDLSSVYGYVWRVSGTILYCAAHDAVQLWVMFSRKKSDSSFEFHVEDSTRKRVSQGAFRLLRLLVP